MGLQFLRPQLPTAGNKNDIECFGIYSYSAGTQHGNRHQLSVTISRVACFIPWAHTGTGVSHSQHRKKLGRGFGKQNAGEWNGRVEISMEEIPGSKRSMYGYILTYSRL